jgi:hypothetical protein
VVSYETIRLWCQKLVDLRRCLGGGHRDIVPQAAFNELIRGGSEWWEPDGQVTGKK